MATEIIPTGAKLGAEVRGIDASDIVGKEDQRALRAALAKHMVLIFREQSVPVDAQIRFAQTFGDLGAIADTLLGIGRRHYQPDEMPECVSVISNIKVDGKKIGSLGDGECFWHTDSCFSETPPSASTLYSVELPPEGGNTAFMDMVDALEALPKSLRARIEGLSIRHSQIYDSTGTKRPAFDEVSDITKAPGPVHPIIRTIPESGRQCLYLGRRLGAYVVGLPVQESEELLDELWAHAVRDHRVYSHRWSLGDLLVWDNRFTMHHRDPFDPNARRRLHKVQVAGERPV
ncbi:MAG: TauD/TfdA family dioxygenase [Alphaproteobacteria bacterium]|nr:TauD/TfdA family dioxygenase [Alphaproteobacteria bacterium]